ncbi:flagellar hook-length control protein FliK [Paraglaciecola aestuariivivens]
MSDISANHSLIANALTQLTQLAPSSESAQRAVEVLVKHLAGQVISLSQPQTLLNKTVLLKQPSISGQLVSDQTHQVKVALDPEAKVLPKLQFYSADSTIDTTKIKISDKQLQQILAISAKSLTTVKPLELSSQPLKVPVIQATVVQAGSTNKVADSQPQKIQDPANSQHKPVVLDTQSKQRLDKTTRPTLSLKLSANQSEQIISLPVKTTTKFNLADKVTLELTPKGHNWQVTVRPLPVNSEQVKLSLNSQIPPPAPANSNNQALSPDNTKAAPQAITAKANIQANQVEPLLRIILPATKAAPIIQASLQQQNTHPPISLPIKETLQQLNKLPTQQSDPIIRQIQAQPIDGLQLQVNKNSEALIALQKANPVATIAIDQDIAKQIQSFRLIDSKQLVKNIELVQGQINSTPIKPTNNPLPSSDKALATPAAEPGSVKTPDSALVNNPKHKPSNLAESAKPLASPIQQPTVSLKQAASQLLELVRNYSQTESIVTPRFLTNQVEQKQLVQHLHRIVNAKAEVPTLPLQAIEKVLSDPLMTKGDIEPSVKQIIEQLIQQIKQSLPQGKEQDASQIRQLLTSPALSLSSAQISTANASPGLLGGLVSLLQISLSARLTRNLSSRSQQITQSINNVLAASDSPVKGPLTSKALNDFSQVEQKHQLIKEIGRILAGHQASKLTNAEQLLQGQDSFYYTLPSAFAGKLNDIELLIKREEQQQQDPSEQAQGKVWQLTMKLSVGEMGELLTKAKLINETVELHFYASNDAVKYQVYNYLPLLRRKLDSLGIEVNKSECQLGKIPDTLQQRPYHVFQAKA